MMPHQQQEDKARNLNAQESILLAWNVIGENKSVIGKNLVRNVSREKSLIYVGRF